MTFSSPCFFIVLVTSFRKGKRLIGDERLIMSVVRVYRFNRSFISFVVKEAPRIFHERKSFHT